jgi:serine/threonine-protein kinase RsbW
MTGESKAVGEVITFSIPSRLELLPVLDRLMEGIAEQMEFDEDTAGEVAISIIEAGTNAIQHGHGHDALKQVDFRFELYPERLLVCVTDTGPGFNLADATISDPTSPEDLLKSRGRGIYIMRKMMDLVDFEIDPKKGTRVFLTKFKRVNGRATAAS